MLSTSHSYFTCEQSKTSEEMVLIYVQELEDKTHTDIYTNRPNTGLEYSMLYSNKFCGNACFTCTEQLKLNLLYICPEHMH